MQYPGGLLSRVGDLAAELLRMAQTRLEMLGVQLQLERDAVLDRLRLGMFAAVAATLSGVTATVWIAVAAPPTLRGTLLGVLTFLWLAIALTAVLLGRAVDRRSARPMFGGIVAQLKRDSATLGTAATVVTAEVEHESAHRARPAA